MFIREAPRPPPPLRPPPLPPPLRPPLAPLSLIRSSRLLVSFDSTSCERNRGKLDTMQRTQWRVPALGPLGRRRAQGDGVNASAVERGQPQRVREVPEGNAGGFAVRRYGARGEQGCAP